MRRTRVPSLFAIVCMAALAAPARAADKRPSTVDVLSAERVTKQIRLHAEDSDVRYTLDGDVDDTGGTKLQAGQVFVTRHALKITVQRLNPLRQRVTVTVKGVDNASKDVIAKLIDAIASIPSVVKPSGARTEALSAVIGPRAAPSTADCSAQIRSALDYVSKLDALLFSNVTSAGRLKSEYDGWARAIDDAFGEGKGGRAAIAAGVAAMGEYQQSLADQIKQAADAIAEVDKAAAQNPADPCGQYAAAVYQFIQLTQPQLRLAQLRKLSQTIETLQTTLAKHFGDDTQWLGRDYVAARDLVVTPQRDADVAVTIVPLRVSAAEASLAVTEEGGASGSLTVEYDTGWVAEAGVGLTAGFITRPKFGTSKNARGETVVSESDENNVSIDPTVMVNFVPRGDGAPLLRPMIQLGAAVSKDTPAVFLGAGWRVFGGSSGIAVGGGLMLAWVKQLDRLSVGDVVSGTTEIDADVKFNPQPKPRWYFGIQYKF